MGRVVAIEQPRVVRPQLVDRPAGVQHPLPEPHNTGGFSDDAIIEDIDAPAGRFTNGNECSGLVSWTSTPSNYNKHKI